MDSGPLTLTPSFQPTYSLPPAAGFNIQLINVGTDTSKDAVFRSAAAYWQSAIMVDVPAYPANFVDWANGQIQYDNGTNVAYWGAVDDVVIFYKFSPIDGPNGVLAEARPILSRPVSNIAISGMMLFDSTDCGPGTDCGDVFDSIVLHEMAHVLGFGNLWASNGCVSGCQPETTGPNYYLCPNAKREFAATAGCSGRLEVETAAPEGSACSHWKEDQLGNELMTPYLSIGVALPVSRITLGAMEGERAGALVLREGERGGAGRRPRGPLR